MDKDAKEARNRRIFDMWMACATQDEIAEACDCSETAVRETISAQSADLPKARKAEFERAVDFEPPIYNIWKQQEKTTLPVEIAECNLIMLVDQKASASAAARLRYFYTSKYGPTARHWQ